MVKQNAIQQLETEHQELKELVDSLNLDQITKDRIFDDWTIKDIVVHISAWNWAVLDAIDEVLAGQVPLGT